MPNFPEESELAAELNDSAGLKNVSITNKNNNLKVISRDHWSVSANISEDDMQIIVQNLDCK